MMLIPRDVGGRFNSSAPQFTGWPAKWHIFGLDTEVVAGRKIDIEQWTTGKTVAVTVGEIVAERFVNTRERTAIRYVVAEIRRET